MRAEAPSLSAWNRALTLTAPYARGGGPTLPAIVAAMALSHGDSTALLDEVQTLTYADLAAQTHRYARWAQHHVASGDVVALMLPNSATYVAIWLGITAVRGTAALINPHLSGDGLAHAVAAVQPRHVIADSAGEQALLAVAARLPPDMQTWSFGPGGSQARIEDAVAPLSPEPLDLPAERVATLADVALYIYTSGTTGLPKAARISHRRVAEWSLWFAGLIDTQPSDRMFNCLPMFHSVGGVVAIGAMLSGGGSVLIRRSFSARSFWDDVVTHRCTVFQYIGELCRHMLNSPNPGPHAGHSLRLCCGNGLRGDVWQDFVARFQIPRVLEFYASTEGNVSLYNVPGRPGAIGHLPGFLAHRAPVVLARCDADSGDLIRGDDGFARVCQPGETGEALGRIASRAFEGYTDQAATEAKIARDVLATGDVWYRTGDLMQRDAAGYFYFVDRLGDNFRWKGENIASAWVADALCRAPAVHDAVVYGVAVPGHEGRAGMAAVSVGADFTPEILRVHLERHLPAYAWPVFLRIVPNISATATFKPQRAALAREGYDLTLVADPLYVYDKSRTTYVRLNAAVLADLAAGGIRV